MFKFQKLSNFGTSTPAVARTVLQAKPIIDFFHCPDAQKEQVLEKFFDLQRHLLKCVEIRESVAAEMAEERNRFLARPHAAPQSRGVITLPGVGDLQSKAEGFLQSAKLAIAATGNLTQPLYGKGFVHHFHKFEEWARTTFGDDDHLTISIRKAKPFVARVVQMRNVVDHPDTAPGAPMRYVNFDIEVDGTEAKLVDPRWGLTDEPLETILVGFDMIIELSICLGERILVDLFYKFRKAEFLVIYEIPLEKRDPSNPKRLIVSVAAGFDAPKQ